MKDVRIVTRRVNLQSSNVITVVLLVVIPVLGLPERSKDVILVRSHPLGSDDCETLVLDI